MKTYLIQSVSNLQKPSIKVTETQILSDKTVPSYDINNISKLNVGNKCLIHFGLNQQYTYSLFRIK